MQKRAGLGLGLLCRLYLRKEHSSKSDFASRESSFVGETLGGDLFGLGYGQDRGAEESRLGVSVRNRKRARVDAMSEVVQGVGFGAERVCFMTSTTNIYKYIYKYIPVYTYIHKK